MTPAEQLVWASAYGAALAAMLLRGGVACVVVYDARHVAHQAVLALRNSGGIPL